MCNNYEQLVGWPAFSEVVRALNWSLPSGQNEGDLFQSASVRIRDLAPVIRAAGNGVELAPMRWGFPPSRPGGGPVFNFRAEARRFGGSRRCLVPASAFFEFTGDQAPKAKHRFTLAGAAFLCVAGLWREAADGGPADFTMLTTAPGPDMAPYHDRQVVILRSGDWPAWIHLTRPEADLLGPLAAGSLRAETVRAAPNR
jgi:putative SOS response-associated peptidase YedK